MTKIEGLWEILAEYGIKTPEQFMEAYRKCGKKMVYCRELEEEMEARK